MVQIVVHQLLRGPGFMSWHGKQRVFLDLGDPVDWVSCPDTDIHFPRTWEYLVNQFSSTAFHLQGLPSPGKLFIFRVKTCQNMTPGPVGLFSVSEHETLSTGTPKSGENECPCRDMKPGPQGLQSPEILFVYRVRTWNPVQVVIDVLQFVPRVWFTQNRQFFSRNWIYQIWM